MVGESKRQRFINQIGLFHDPFETPVAEQEVGRVHDVFYSYYSPPASFYPQGELSLKNLRHPHHTFVFGNPGSGKSTLRLTLEADCRTVLDNTLTITNILGEDIENPPSFESHGVRLSRALAIELTLSIIERFNPLDASPNKKQIRALQQQIHNGGRLLNRLIRTILEKLENLDKFALDPLWGISKDWNIIGKASVKYVGGSEELKGLLKNSLAVSTQEKVAGWDAFWEGLNAAREWGFSRFLVLIDGVDTKKRTPEAMMAIIKPLLDILHKAEAEEVFFKFFLPMDLKDIVQAYIQDSDKDLYSSALFSIIEWDDKALRRLLTQRFRAADSHSGLRYMGLNELATQNLNLDENVIQAAGKSPRHLLNIISDLIDIHIARDPDSLKFSQEDWETCQRKLRRNIRNDHIANSDNNDNW